MRDPNAYPEMILASAQEEIEELARHRAQKAARSRGSSRWWRRVTRSPRRN